MFLPRPRGPVSQNVIDSLRGQSPLRDERLVRLVESGPEVTLDEDVQLALWTLYELHYAGFEDCQGDPEFNPDLLRVRGAIEARFEAELRSSTARSRSAGPCASGGVAERIFAQAAAANGRSLSLFLQREATVDQFRELLVHRSIYQLKEADPHTFVVPRVHGAVKVALVELQFDEYGAGRPERQHARLFAEGMAGCGLEGGYGAYVDCVPAVTLALNNAMSLLCLHRRFRGAALGHLAAIEVTSSLPCRRYVQGLRRLELAPAMIDYFDEHVEADSVHEQVATHDICAALVEQDPRLADDVLFGVAVSLHMDELLAEHVLASFERRASSLRAPHAARGAA